MISFLVGLSLIAFGLPSSATAGGGAWNTDLGIDGGNNIDVNPHFIDPAQGNLRLKTISPAIDAGYNFPVIGVPTDLDGNPRFVDTPTIPDTSIGEAPIVDMGAYEAQALHLTINIVGDGEVNKNPDQPTYNLTEQVTLTANADPGWAFSGWSGDTSAANNPLTINSRRIPLSQPYLLKMNYISTYR